MSESKSIPLTRIIPSRWQPRNAVFDAEKLWELASSIKENKLINAVIVFPVTLAEDDPEPWYELVAGERRTRASAGLAWGKLDVYITPKTAVEKLAQEGLAALPDNVRALLEEGGASIEATVESDGDLERLHRVAVVENLERESLSAFEEAAALQTLSEEYGWSQRELAKRIGKSQSFVAQRLALMGLSDELKGAVNTRVLTPTHARAIASVPNELQSVVTEWAAGAVNKADTPATTRQVQNRARQLAAFVDPDQWLPNEETVYRPKLRNRLALMQWALARADLETRGEALLALANTSYSNSNWLAKKPIGLVESHYGLSEALSALGHSSVSAPWREFAAKTGRQCDTCALSHVAGDVPHCRLDDQSPTCQGWIGMDAIVIPLDRALAAYFEELEIKFDPSPFPHVTLIAPYVTGLTMVQAFKEEQQREAAEEQSVKHVHEIKAFVDWQSEQPDEVLAHFQAHACVKCANYRQRADVPCRFVDEPLPRYGSLELRSPEFGLLVDEAGRMYPRCKQFSYDDIPFIFKHKNTKFGERTQVMEWLHVLASGGSVADPLRGVLCWLDYGLALGKSNEYDKLKRWIKSHWGELGGDGGIATLLDAAMFESRTGRRQPFKLLDPTTNEVTRFAAVDWKAVSGDGYFSTYSYPSDWPRPWEETSSDSAQQA